MLKRHFNIIYCVCQVYLFGDIVFRLQGTICVRVFVVQMFLAPINKFQVVSYKLNLDVGSDSMFCH